MLLISMTHPVRLALQMGVLGEKLLKELRDDARVVSCRFPFPDWPHQSSVGRGLEQTFAYDISTVKTHLRNAQNTADNKPQSLGYPQQH